MKAKNPWVAAVLNFLLFGGGTVYIGRRSLVGFLMILGGNIAQAAEIKISPAVDNAAPSAWPFLISGLVILKIACAIDGYREARSASLA